VNKASVHLMLADLFNWHLTSETSGWPPINILHRVSTEGNVTSSGRPGHKVLCREMNPDQRRIQKAYNSLSTELKIVVCAKHMGVPLKEDKTPIYNKWGDYEKAHYLTESIGVFKNQYKRAIRGLQKTLHNS
jgi:hypothetical protein